MHPHLRIVLTATLLSLPATALPAQSATQNDSSARAATRTNSLPLINTRNLKFTTDEGSWISLDLSPNGQTIVFDLLGDLYTLPVAGGTATRITSGPAAPTLSGCQRTSAPSKWGSSRISRCSMGIP